MTQRQHLHTKDDYFAARALQSICEHSVCSQCQTTLSIKQADVSEGRAIVVVVEQYRQGPRFELFLCTYCTYHHTRAIPEQHRTHWTKDGKWSQLGAPLDEKTATSFCNMLSAFDSTGSASWFIVVVL